MLKSSPFIGREHSSFSKDLRNGTVILQCSLPYRLNITLLLFSGESYDIRWVAFWFLLCIEPEVAGIKSRMSFTCG